MLLIKAPYKCIAQEIDMEFINMFMGYASI